MAGSVIVKITIKGLGGHGSTPHLLRDPITPAAYLHTALHSIKSRSVDSKQNCVFTICQFTSGHTYNVFPDEAFMQGTIRYYDDATCNVIKERIRTLSEHTAKAHNCEAVVEIIDLYPPVINHEKETNIVESIAKEFLPEGYFSTDSLPLTASEDFSYFLHEKTGCFYMLGITKPNEAKKTLHTSTYDYNDNVIATGGMLYLRIVENRLGVKILN